MTGWKVGQPRDSVTRGKWWEIFGDADLNALEEQIDVNSQTIAQAEANYRGARAPVRIARSGLFPTLTTAPVVTGTQSSANSSAASTGFKPSAFATAQIPFDGTWDADVWGRVRRTIEASIETAQASASVNRSKSNPASRGWSTRNAIRTRAGVSRPSRVAGSKRAPSVERRPGSSLWRVMVLPRLC